MASARYVPRDCYKHLLFHDRVSHNTLFADFKFSSDRGGTPEASREVNARVNYWINELSSLVNHRGRFGTGPRTRSQDGNHLSFEYEVRRDPAESAYLRDPEPGRAGIEICLHRAADEYEPVLLGLSCDRNGGLHKDDMVILVLYIMKDQQTLAERLRPLHCFITNGSDEIRFFEFELGEYNNENKTEWSWDDLRSLHADRESLSLSEDSREIQRYLLDAIAHNERLAETA